jgi:hypothetical protein
VKQIPPPAGAPPPPVSCQQFDAEVRQAVRSERWLPVKALFALALVARHRTPGWQQAPGIRRRRAGAGMPGLSYPCAIMS